MANITYDSDGRRELHGPLFDDDPLVLAEEILDLREPLNIDYAVTTAGRLAERLIWLDIAKSLRILCDAPGVQSYHGKYGDKHTRTIPVPRRPIQW